jgi:hypothetical protein
VWYYVQVGAGADRAVLAVQAKTEEEQETVDGRAERDHVIGRRNSEAAPHQLDHGRADGMVLCDGTGKMENEMRRVSRFGKIALELKVRRTSAKYSWVGYS